MRHPNGKIHINYTTYQQVTAPLGGENLLRKCIECHSFIVRVRSRQSHQLDCIREPRSRTSTLNWPRTSRCKRCVVLSLQHARRTAGQSVCTWYTEKADEIEIP